VIVLPICVLVRVLLSLTACARLCAGPGCEGAWPAARIGVQTGDLWIGDRDAWSDSALRWVGANDDGSDWVTAVAEERLFVGQPEVGRVVWFPTDGGEFTAQIVPEGEVDGPVGFGTRLVVTDLDGDGHADLVVGSPQEDLGRGRVATWIDVRDDQDVDAEITGISSGDRVGDTLAACGDIDGDGHRDLAIGAPHFSGTFGDIPELVGGVWLDYQQASGTVDDLDTGMWSTEAGAAFGSSIACDADLDADGRADVVVGSPLAGAGGRVDVFSGMKPPIGAITGSTFILSGVQDARIGASLATSDFTGDGVADLAIGADGGRGSVSLLAGPDWSEVARFGLPEDHASSDHFGRSLLGADVDGDGIADIIAGTPEWRDTVGWDAGRLWLWYGGEAVSAGPDATIGSTQPFSRIGRGMSAGDLDGDGLADLVLPARTRAR
jgi:hypothetical protein